MIPESELPGLLDPQLLAVVLGEQYSMVQRWIADPRRRPQGFPPVIRHGALWRVKTRLVIRWLDGEEFPSDPSQITAKEEPDVRTELVKKYKEKETAAKRRRGRPAKKAKIQILPADLMPKLQDSGQRSVQVDLPHCADSGAGE
jgi:hypothetical protein